MGCLESNIYRFQQDKYLQMLDRRTANLSESNQNIGHLTTKSVLSSQGNKSELDRSYFSESKQLLGIGGFGVVRLVEKKYGQDKNKMYALKSLSKYAVLKRQSGVSSVSAELSCLKLIGKHPFICCLHYAFQDAAYLYLVLDLTTCGDLRVNIRLAKNNRFDEDVAKFFAVQLFIAVFHLHSLNIIHRGTEGFSNLLLLILLYLTNLFTYNLAYLYNEDIKPENILVNENGYIKLSDFGVAKILPDISAGCHSTSGTHGYMVRIYACI